jgi:hypothetical protein
MDEGPAIHVSMSTWIVHERHISIINLSGSDFRREVEIRVSTVKARSAKTNAPISCLQCMGKW